MELTESGRIAEDIFMRQMRRLRADKGFSEKELADKVVEMGGSLHPHDIALIENGRRSLRPAEADALAKALGSTVQDMLFSAIQDVSGDSLQADSTEEELEAEARAAERRILDVSKHLDRLSHRLSAARERLTFMQREVDVAQMTFDQVMTEKMSLEHQYHYVLGRLHELRGDRESEESGD